MSDDNHETVEGDDLSAVDSSPDSSPDGAENSSNDGEADAEHAAALEESSDAIIAKLEADLHEARDASLRAQADAVNAQRRAEGEVDKARKFALERFVGEMLPVVDNLERALTAADESDTPKAIIEGVALTLKSLVDALAKNGVDSIDPVGEPYDPQTAQAMSMVENPDVEPNTVTAVMQKGYRLNGRLIRPAMVMVSKAAE